MKSYSSLEAIRRETAMLNVAEEEEIGTGDGTQKVFYSEFPIADPVAVFSVAASGEKTSYRYTLFRDNKITLASAPATDVAVLMTYKWSNIDDDRVEEARKKAVSWVHRCLDGIFDYTSWGNDIPLDVQTAVAYYAAGLILTGEHGLATEEGLPTDGRSKLKLAKEMMMDIKESLKQNQGTTRVAPQGSLTPKPFREEA